MAVIAEVNPTPAFNLRLLIAKVPVPFFKNWILYVVDDVVEGVSRKVVFISSFVLLTFPPYASPSIIPKPLYVSPTLEAPITVLPLKSLRITSSSGEEPSTFAIIKTLFELELGVIDTLKPVMSVKVFCVEDVKTFVL